MFGRQLPSAHVRFALRGERVDARAPLAQACSIVSAQDDRHPRNDQPRKRHRAEPRDDQSNGRVDRMAADRGRDVRGDESEPDHRKPDRMKAELIRDSAGSRCRGAAGRHREAEVRHKPAVIERPAGPVAHRLHGVTAVRRQHHQQSSGNEQKRPAPPRAAEHPHPRCERENVQRRIRQHPQRVAGRPSGYSSRFDRSPRHSQESSRRDRAVDQRQQRRPAEHIARQDRCSPSAMP